MARVLIIDVKNNRRGVVNKSVNAGLGTRTVIGTSWRAKLLEFAKKRGVVIPMIEYAYVASLLRSKGHQMWYKAFSMEDIGGISTFLETKQIDLVIFYPALVSHTDDFQVAKQIRQLKPALKLGAFGPFASNFGDICLEFFDWVISGEVESVLLKKDLSELQGVVKAEGVIENLDSIPFPDWSIFEGQAFSYKPMLSEEPFFTMLGSRGCPMSCGHYCPYPASQGAKWRFRSTDSLVEEIKYLQAHYNAKGVLFRDAYFSMNKKRTREFAEKLLQANVKIKWACETRIESLSSDLIDLLYKSGLRSINIGVESEDKTILTHAGRATITRSKEELLVDYCYKKGIKINAFYILGLMEDTLESVRKTIRYAKSLNTFTAQFTINTPLPGTPWYKEMQDKILTSNLEELDNNTLVFQHPNLSREKLAYLKEEAFLKYYFSLGFFKRKLFFDFREVFGLSS